MTKRQENKLDREIEAIYKTHANGRQIDIMDIGKLFAESKKLYLAGEPLEVAVKKQIEIFCK